MHRIGALDRWVDMVLGIEMNSSSDWIVAMLVLLLIIMFGTPMHVLSGYLVGLEVTRQTHFMKVALFTFLIRSLFMLNIFLWCAIFDSVKPIVAGESVSLLRSTIDLFCLSALCSWLDLAVV